MFGTCNLPCLVLNVADGGIFFICNYQLGLDKTSDLLTGCLLPILSLLYPFYTL